MRGAGEPCLVLACAAVVIAVVQWARPGLWSIDGYFHIRYADVIRAQGISRTFPWWQETFLRDHWADKELLYHLLLIPFTLGDLLAGAKAAAVVFSTLALGAFWIVARRLRVPWPAAWTLALLGLSPMFLYRLSFTRSWVVALVVALAGTAAILSGRPRESAIAAAIYPGVHVSYHLIPCVALVHDLLTWRETGRRSFRVSAWTAGGTAAGVLLSPFFPNNLRLWWVQNIDVLRMAWSRRSGLRIGAELLPPRADTLVIYNLGLFAVVLATLFVMARAKAAGARFSTEAVTLGVIGAGFLVLSLLSSLFIEFWVPFTMLFAGVAARDVLDRSTGSPSPLRWGRVAVAVALLSGAALSGWTAVAIRRAARSEPEPDLSRASAWMRAHIPAGETVFHLDWDEFPQLFFHNPQLHYLVGLDPTFMLATDAARWRLLDDVGNGRVPEAFSAIRATFGCRWVFASPDDDEFLLVARRDPRFDERYRDRDAVVFSLTDGYRFVRDWKVTGYWADPDRRLYDVPLPPEPRRGAAGGSAPEPTGPAARGIEARGVPGFVDLDRLLAVPSGRGDACGVAEASVDADAGEARLGITTDDEIRVYLNGEEVLAFSPRRTPPPGTRGGPPIPLEEFLRIRPRVAERTVSLPLRSGRNAIAVKSCRLGEDFGFFLRLTR